MSDCVVVFTNDQKQILFALSYNPKNDDYHIAHYNGSLLFQPKIGDILTSCTYYLQVSQHNVIEWLLHLLRPPSIFAHFYFTTNEGYTKIGPAMLFENCNKNEHQQKIMHIITMIKSTAVFTEENKL